MVNYSHILRTRWFSSSVFIALLLLMTLSYTHAQPCPVLDGGQRHFVFTSSSSDVFFPATLPAGESGSGRATAGRLRTADPMTVAYPLRTVTINPEFTDGTVGSVVLRFDILGMAAPGAVIKIYPGTTATGTPAEEITSTTAASYLLQTRVYNGPVTVTFESPTPAASGSFNIRITYTTGDQVITSPFGFQVAYWTNFITPNSYTAIENYPEWAVPIATAYFNESKQLVSSEISFCTDYGESAPSIGNAHYPGQFVFHPTVRTDYDENGTVEPIDQLIAARIVYILSHAPQPISNFDNFLEVQSAIDATNNDPNGSYGGLFGQAKAAIPSLNSPVEPVFSITGPSSGVAPGVAQNFVVNLTNDGGSARVYTLFIPAGITLNSVTGTGVTYDAVNKTITFASAPASATVSVTSAVNAVATIRVEYNQPGFWNVNNLLVYEPCDTYPKATYQGFLGISKGNTPFPFREATGIWDSALPVKLVNFQANAERDVVNLSWVTTSEENSKYFEIQRSADAKNWKILGFVNVKSINGNSASTLTYGFTDPTPLNGPNYYRLKMVDLDDTFAYSRIQSASVDTPLARMVAYPNPVSGGKLTIAITGTQSYNAEVHNLSGVRVLQQNLGKDRELNVSGLVSGLYVLSVKSASGDVHTSTFLVK